MKKITLDLRKTNKAKQIELLNIIKDSINLLGLSGIKVRVIKEKRLSRRD